MRVPVGSDICYIDVDTDCDVSAESCSTVSVGKSSDKCQKMRKCNKLVIRTEGMCVKKKGIPSESNDYQSNSLDINHLRFLLECFVLSFGPEGPQLGRNHPDSDPERYATNMTDECSSNTCDRNSDDDPSPSYSRSGPSSTLQNNRNGYRYSSWNIHVHSELLDDYEIPFPDELLLRELSEMRTLLERLLENREMGEWHNENELLDILGLLPNANWSNKESSPHYPVGEWNFKECGICLEMKWLYCRHCCQYPACNSCLQLYYTSKVEQGIIQIECCNPTCHSYVHRDEISARLHNGTKETFYKLLASANINKFTKTCPRCSHVTRANMHDTKNRKQIPATRIQCPACQLEWCFVCHAPWHAEMTCKQFQKGDRLLKSWAKEMNQGQLNAQRCPKCKIYIQRTSGCDHMHCTRCKTDFCYRCGDKFRRLKFFGDHYSKLSIFGCKYRYKSDKPIQRKVIRGTIFGSKIIVAPMLGTLALCAGAVAVGLGIFILPLYGGLRLYRRYENHKQAKNARRLPMVYRSSCKCELGL